MLTKRKIKSFFLTPHASHVLQPQDQHPFATFKKMARAHTLEVMGALFKLGRCVHIQDMPYLLYASLTESHSPEVLSKSLRVTGLLPFDPDKVLAGKMKSAKNYQELVNDLNQQSVASASSSSSSSAASSSASSSAAPALDFDFSSVSEPQRRSLSDVGGNRDPHAMRQHSWRLEHLGTIVIDMPKSIMPNAVEQKVSELKYSIAFVVQLGPGVDQRAVQLSREQKERQIHTHSEALESFAAKQEKERVKQAALLRAEEQKNQPAAEEPEVEMKQAEENIKAKEQLEVKQVKKAPGKKEKG